MTIAPADLEIGVHHLRGLALVAVSNCARNGDITDLRIAICRPRFIIAVNYESRCKGRTACWYPLVLIFAILAVGIVAGGIFYYRNYERHFRDEAEQQLSAIAELKVDELAQYRKERLWDADAFFKNTAFSGLVRRFFEHPEDAEAQQQLQEWAGQIPGDRSV